jgi:hypothetical protein
MIENELCNDHTCESSNSQQLISSIECKWLRTLLCSWIVRKIKCEEFASEEIYDICDIRVAFNNWFNDFRFTITHVMITLLSNNTKTRRSTTTTARERQRTYCDSVFELRTIVNNIYRYLKFYDIKRAESDDVRGSSSRPQIFNFRSNLKKQHLFISVLYKCM